MVSIGYGNPRAIDDIKLTRFACYIIAQNGSPVKKPKIAEAQAYILLFKHASRRCQINIDKTWTDLLVGVNFPNQTRDYPLV